MEFDHYNISNKLALKAAGSDVSELPPTVGRLLASFELKPLQEAMKEEKRAKEKEQKAKMEAEMREYQAAKAARAEQSDDPFADVALARALSSSRSHHRIATPGLTSGGGGERSGGTSERSSSGGSSVVRKTPKHRRMGM